MRGAIVWALVPFQPEAPFELDGRSFPTVVDVARAIRDGTLSRAPAIQVEVKLRPVVLLQDRPHGSLPEYAALKLARLDKYSRADQERVRQDRRPSLLHLPATQGLRRENAIDLTSLVRIHRSAIASAPVGYLKDDDLDAVNRRLATYLDIDLEPAIAEGVAKRWAKLVAAQRRGEA
jgi:hypothetical protein